MFPSTLSGSGRVESGRGWPEEGALADEKSFLTGLKLKLVCSRVKAGMIDGDLWDFLRK